MTDRYKAQAKRLAAHLADKLGVKLKHASVLEAVAALHGARDWNTLVGAAEASASTLVSRVLRTQPGPSETFDFEEVLYRRTDKGFCLGLTQKKNATVDLSDEQLNSHLLICGNTGGGGREMLDQLMAQQALRGGGLLLLDPTGSSRTLNMLQRAMKAAERDDFDVLASREDPALEKNFLKAAAGLDLAAAARSSRVSCLSWDDLDLAEQSESLSNFARHGLLRLMFNAGPAPKAKTPFMVVLVDAKKLLPEQWAELGALARADGIRLVFHLNTLTGVSSETARQELLANTQTKVFYRAGTQQELQLMTQCLAAQYGADHVQNLGLERRLSELSLGEALYTTPQGVQPVLTRVSVNI